MCASGATKRGKTMLTKKQSQVQNVHTRVLVVQLVPFTCVGRSAVSRVEWPKETVWCRPPPPPTALLSYLSPLPEVRLSIK